MRLHLQGQDRDQDQKWEAKDQDKEEEDAKEEELNHPMYMVHHHRLHQSSNRSKRIDFRKLIGLKLRDWPERRVI